MPVASLAFALFLDTLSPAQAVITRHDVSDVDYRVEDADYPALVDLFEPDDCMGTLIEASHLLTVAHCAVDLEPGQTLDVAGVPHAIEAVRLHENWNDQDHWDIAVVRFSVPVTHVQPLPIYRGSSELGREISVVGRGTSGTALVGEEGGTNDARLRRATNTVLSATEFLLEIEMNRPEDASVTALEGVGAAGDSGGPVFMEIDGVQYIVGLNAFGDAYDGQGIGEYGAFDYQTRVAYYGDWLEAAIGELPDGGTIDQEPIVQGPPQEQPSGTGCSSVAGRGANLWLLLLVGLPLARIRQTRR